MEELFWRSLLQRWVQQSDFLALASYLAANLVVLFAQMGRKVLLIDANLR